MMAPIVVPHIVIAAETEAAAPKYIFLFIGDGMSYPQIPTTNFFKNAMEDDGDEILPIQNNLSIMN